MKSYTWIIWYIMAGVLAINNSHRFGAFENWPINLALMVLVFVICGTILLSKDK